MRKAWTMKVCGECYFRNYGTDTHYVCHNMKAKQESGVNRVNMQHKACKEFRQIKRLK